MKIVDKSKEGPILWHTKYIVNKQVIFKRFSISIEWRSRKSTMGRFGGGWNWHLGIEASRNTAIFFLLVFMIIIDVKRRDAKRVN